MKTAITVGLLPLLISGCKKKDKFVTNLTDQSNGKHWTKEEVDSVGRFHILWDRYEFNTDGTYNWYLGDSTKSRGNLFIPVDGKFTFKWKYNNKDSILTISTVFWKVTKVTADSILMKDIYSNARFALINYSKSKIK